MVVYPKKVYYNLFRKVLLFVIIAKYYQEVFYAIRSGTRSFARYL